jgi:hypothetical protein
VNIGYEMEEWMEDEDNFEKWKSKYADVDLC